MRCFCGYFFFLSSLAPRIFSPAVTPSVRKAQLHLAFVESLLLGSLGAGQHVDVALALLELHGALREGQHPFAALDHHAGVGAVTRPHENLVRNRHGRLDLEEHHAVVLGGLRRDIFQQGVQLDVLQCTDGEFHGHALPELAHVRLIDVAPEEHVRHVGHRGDRRAVVERVGLNHRVADLDRHVEDHAVDRRTYLRVAQFLETARYAVLHDFEVLPGVLQLLFGLGEGGAALLGLLVRDDAFRVQSRRAVVFAAGLRQRDFGHRDARFGARQLAHFGYDLHRGDHFALAHRLSGLLADVGDDARDLGFDQHLVARFDLARGHHELFERVQFGLYDRVDDLHRTGFLPQEPEGSQ